MVKGIGATRCRVVAIVVVATVAMAALAGSAAAKPSGERTHGKEIVELQCEGLGTVTVSVPSSEKNNGVGQIVGEKGHGIPVTFNTTITDVSTGTVLFTESHSVGNGHAHRNQPTTACRGTFEATAAQFFEEGPLPEGVSPEDLIRGVFEADVIVKK
jgi:hypothetical protein